MRSSMGSSRFAAALFSFFLLIGMLFLTVSPASAQPSPKVVLITGNGYVPGSMTIHQGETVQLIVQNTDDQVHNLVIPGLGVTSPILMKGEMAALTFSASKKGTYRFFSNSHGAPEPGFAGTIHIQ